MRLEHLPVVLGLVAAFVGVMLIADAWLAEQQMVPVERRRRQRAERHRGGEALLGLAALSLSLALFGRDTWRYTTLAVLVGAVAFVWGAWLNRELLIEMLRFRGAARRAPPGVDVTKREGRVLLQRGEAHAGSMIAHKSATGQHLGPERRLRIR